MLEQILFDNLMVIDRYAGINLDFSLHLENVSRGLVKLKYYQLWNGKSLRD